MRFSARWEEGHFFAAFYVVFKWLNYLFLILVCLLVGWFFAELLNFYSFLFFFPSLTPQESPTFKMCLLGRNISVRHPADTLKTSCVLVTDVIWKYLVFDSTNILLLMCLIQIISISLVLSCGSEVLAYTTILRSQICINKTLLQALLSSNIICLLVAEVTECHSISLHS